MDSSLTTLDFVMVAIYFVIIIGVGLYASCKGSKGSVKGYFLAGRDVNFFMIGASLFVSNIGAEHFMGLSGSGAALGIGVGAWEFIAMVGLQILGFVFLPVYLACQTRTMPEYLHKRFGGQRIRVYYAVLSILQYVLTKCSVGLFTGAVFMQQALQLNLYVCTAILIGIVAVLTLAGGLAAVLYTDTVQFFIMMAGGIVITVMGFREVGGFSELWRRYPLALANDTSSNATCGGEIHPQWDVMLRSLSDPNLPWLGFIFGALPGITWYLCADQVMVQRALAARSLTHGQSAVIMTSFFKVLPFFLMVFPGMISRVLFTEEVACVDPDVCFEVCENRAGCSNIAFPRLVMGILPQGLRGLMMSVLIAAVMSDLDSFFNSASTIFAVDIWTRIRKKPSSREQMIVGRLFLVLVAGLSLAWVPVLKELNSGQVFLYITEVANHLAAPSAAIFLLAVIWPRATEKGAFTGLLVGLLPGVVRLVLVWSYPTPEACSGVPDTRPSIIKDVPYLYVTFSQFLVALLSCVVVSLCTDPPEYKQIYKTTIWTKNESRDINDVNSGNVIGTWTTCCYHPSDESNQTDVQISVVKRFANKDADTEEVVKVNNIELRCNYEETSGEKTDIPPSKKTWSAKFKDWICGEDITEEANEEEEAEEYSLEQTPLARTTLYVMSALSILVCVTMLTFWSVWKYRPEEIVPE